MSHETEEVLQKRRSRRRCWPALGWGPQRSTLLPRSCRWGRQKRAAVAHGTAVRGPATHAPATHALGTSIMPVVMSDTTALMIAAGLAIRARIDPAGSVMASSKSALVACCPGGNRSWSSLMSTTTI